MQQPSLSRAIPMAIIGFILGAMLVILIRALQQVDPVWSPGAGLVLAVFNCAIFFIWGMGGFDARWSVVEEDHEAEAHTETALAEVKPKLAVAETGQGTFSSSIWQIATLVIGLLVVMAAVVSFGPQLIITRDASASTGVVGYAPMTLFGQDYQVSQLVLLLIFVVLTLLSLVVFALIGASVFGFFARGLKQAQVEAAGGAAALPAPAGMITGSTEPASPLRRIRSLVTFAIVFVILYLLFYYVAIGLLLPNNPMLGPISFVNALLFTFLILRTQLVLNVIGIVARWLLHVLGGLPGVFQK